MKNIFQFWLVAGAIMAIILGVYNAETFTWGPRTVLAVVAGGLLFTFPLALVYGWIMFLVGKRKERK